MSEKIARKPLSKFCDTIDATNLLRVSMVAGDSQNAEILTEIMTEEKYNT